MSKPWYAFSKRAAAYVAASACVAWAGSIGGASVWAAKSVRVPAAESSPFPTELPSSELSIGARSGGALTVGDTVAYSLSDPTWQIDPSEGGLKNGFLFRPGKLFTPLAPGTLRLPPLRVLDPNGALVARSTPVELTISSNLTEKEQNDPKGPQPEAPIGPQSLPYPKWVQSLVAFSILGFFLVGVFFLLRYLRRKAASALKRMLPKKPYDQVTLERLDALAKADYLEKRNFKPYYFGISDGLKFYFGERFAFDAQESTTSELFALLRERVGEPGLSEAIVGRFELLFSDLDPVKFADRIPTDAEAREALREARDLVLATRKIVADPILKNGSAVDRGPR